MIDVTCESLLTPTQAARHPALVNPDGRPCHLAKVYRLFSKGVLGPDGTRQRLEFVRVPGGTRTSAEAIQRLVERLTLGGSLSAPATTTAARRRAEAAVDRELDEAGIGVCDRPWS